MTFSLAGLLSAGAMAQYPYTIALSGTVTNCYPGQVVTVQTIQGTLPQQSFTVALDSNTCSYSVFVSVSNQPAWLEVTTLCGGMIQYGSDSSQFNFVGDTMTSVIDLLCGGGTYDCLQILNGPNMPGAPCTTFLGAQGEWSADCACETNTLDCLGILNGPNNTGTTCDDGDSTTINDVWSISCQCEGQIPGYIDCLGIPNGPNVIWTPCVNTIDSVTYVGYWNFGCYCVGDSLNSQFDCMGVLGGNAWPGTPCEDGDPLTTNDTWSFDCACTGIDTSGTYDCLQILNGPNMPGTACVWNNQPGLWSMGCICVPDSGNVFDCLGVVNGQNMPGTYCVNFFGDTGVWSLNCVCETNANTFDCLGVLNGTALPGTVCVYTPDSGNTFITGIWSGNCVCQGDTSNTQYDCLGVLNGPAQPGSACTVPGTTLEGIWSSNCVCEINNLPCQADFWVLQAYGSDSLPIPYELWVWNLSSGGSGVFTYAWDFGDGTSSTEPYPTHTYSGNGPYLLCLTIADNSGCTSVHCDSISIDPNGIYSGIMGGEGDRTDGFTINVQNPSANSVNELAANNDIVAWPNPTAGELNIAMTNSLSGNVEVTITDLNGRVVLSEARRLINGKNQLRLSTENLGAGMYMVRIGNGRENVSVRFVKAN
ncbi:MAG: T9SS type A sorting domain-containing protein [Flavobacteriales bacterium]|nr:T9SS type A sorting domain-containing protein [Flavobacteriales bacterium]